MSPFNLFHLHLYVILTYKRKRCIFVISPQLPGSSFGTSFQAHGNVDQKVYARERPGDRRTGTLQVFKPRNEFWFWQTVLKILFRRNCLLHLAALLQEGLISTETASNCVIILQVGSFWSELIFEAVTCRKL